MRKKGNARPKNKRRKRKSAFAGESLRGKSWLGNKRKIRELSCSSDEDWLKTTGGERKQSCCCEGRG